MVRNGYTAIFIRPKKRDRSIFLSSILSWTLRSFVRHCICCHLSSSLSICNFWLNTPARNEEKKQVCISLHYRSYWHSVCSIESVLRYKHFISKYTLLILTQRILLRNIISEHTFISFSNSRNKWWGQLAEFYALHVIQINRQIFVKDVETVLFCTLRRTSTSIEWTTRCNQASDWGASVGTIISLN